MRFSNVVNIFLMTWVIYWTYSDENFVEHLNSLSKEQVENARIKFPSYHSRYHEIIYWKD